MIKKLLPALIAVGLLFVALSSWRHLRTADAQSLAPPPVPVVATTVKAQAVPASLETVGTLEAVREVLLAPETAGRIIDIRFTAGTQVRKGDLLVQLDDAPERADREAARARAEFARLQLKRSQELAPTGAEPHALLEQRQAEYDQAMAAVRQLDARIAQKAIRAPFTGRIGIRRVHPGQYLSAGDPVASLVALDPLHVNFSVPQQEFSRLRQGQSVEVMTDAWPGRTFTARINAIEPMVSAETRNISVQALLNNEQEALRPGMYVAARLVLPPEPNGILIPATALQTSASGDSVTLIKDGVATPVPVRAGRRIGESVVIARGLRPGDVIVTEGQLRLQPGARVAIATTGQKG